MNIEELNKYNKDCMVDHLGIQITRFEGSTIEGTMPVDSRTVQPFRNLHGGATVALAETLGSYGSHLLIDSTQYNAVGIEINCNHLRAVRSGSVLGIGTCIHQGRKTHVWSIEVFDDEKRLIATSRITVMIVPTK